MKAWHAVASYIFRYTLLPFPQPIPVVEGVSKLSFQCGSRDAKFCVSTIWLDKLLILNVLYVVVNIETFCVSTIVLGKLLILSILHTAAGIESLHAVYLKYQHCYFDTLSTAIWVH